VFFTAAKQFCYFIMTVRHSTTWPNVFSVFKLLHRTSARMMS
jgi:hypothetical protein